MSDRERELEAEIASLREQDATLAAEVERWKAKWAEADKTYWQLLDGECRTSLGEIASLREQNATLRAEVERLTKGGGE